MSPEDKFPSSLKRDLPASIVVFLVAVPLCLGIALASGAPLVSGLIAGIVGGIVVGVLGGSSLGVSGPAAGLAVIVLTAIQELGAFDIFLVAVVLAGIIQLGLGYARAGVIAYYFPSSVITGMLSGIGIVIFLKQIPHAFGYDKDPEGDLSFFQPDGETTFSALVSAFQSINFGALLITAVSLAILIAWEQKRVKGHKILGLVPGPLLAVTTGIILAWVLGSSDSLSLRANQFVSIPLTDGLASLLALLTFPDFSALGSTAVYKVALVLAVVASLETLLCVEATDKLDPLKRVTSADRELKAQGVGNILAGLVGGLPITQVIVRSSANIQAGGRTRASAIAHGFLILVSVIALPSLMNMIPLASLAAVLFLVGYKLAKPSLFKKMFREGPGVYVPFGVTILGIVFTDLLTGIALGLVAAIGRLLIENFRLPFESYRFPQERGENIRIVLAQQVTFLNKASIRQFLNSIPDDAKVEIDARASAYVHGDVVEIIDDFVAGAGSRNLQVVVRGLDHHEKGQPAVGMNITVVPPEGLESQTAGS